MWCLPLEDLIQKPDVPVSDKKRKLSTRKSVVKKRPQFVSENAGFFVFGGLNKRDKSTNELYKV